MNTKKRRKKMLIVVSLFLLGFFFVPGFRSEIIMRPASFLAYRDSVMRNKGFQLVMPGGNATFQEDWSPSMKIFHTTAFESAEHPISATILYNFGSFSEGRSRLYDATSAYEMAYYGAYAVTREGDEIPFGFTARGELDPSELSMIPLYDLEVLVLRGLGCPKELAKTKITSIEESKVGGAFSLMGDHSLAEDHPLAGWIRLDTRIETRSVIHAKKGWNQNDLQYGPPPKHVEEDFPPLILKGRIYVKHFPEWESSVFLYVFAKDEALIEETDRQFLQHVKIYGRNVWAH
ncbi:hypothetical protein SANA_31850 [Gottschalkiaceae bacterium SANA]|nr:hypothetical protein SANA_31850 [Gottschalkiaceae bacterium SANA]